MFCGRCGQQLDDNAVVCPNCGRVFTQNVNNGQPANAQAGYSQQQYAPLNQAAPYQNEQRYEAYQYQQGQAPAAPKKKIKLPVLLGVIGGLVVIIALIIFLATRPKNINLEDYVKVEFYNDSSSYSFWGSSSSSDLYNGHTSARASLDSEKLALVLARELGLHIQDFSSFDASKVNPKTYEKMEKLEEALDSIDYEIVLPMGVENGKISNGDEVTILITYDKSLLKGTGISFSGKEVKDTARNLIETQVIDPLYDDLEYSFSGFAPNGELSLRYTGNYSFMSSYSFDADKYYGLSNGDVITVTLAVDEETALSYGYSFAHTSREITVEGLDGYMNSLDQLTEKADADIKKELDDFVQSMYATNDEKSINSYEFLGYYLLVNKNQNSYHNNNFLYVIYKADINYTYSGSSSSKKGESENVTAYKYIVFSNVEVLADGTVYVDLTNYDNPTVDNWGWGTGFKSPLGYYYAGYKSLDQLYNDIVTANLKDYTYDSTVSE